EKILMKVLKKLTIFCFCAVFAFNTAASAQDDIKVRLNGIAGDGSQIIDFGETAPIQIDNRTFVPIRAFGEAAGMTVGWDQENHTAFLKIAADEESQIPIEAYAAELFDTFSNRALGAPQSITVSLMLTNSKALVRFNYDVGDGNVEGFGKMVDMDAAAILVNGGSLMIPLRAVSDLLGMTVEWTQEDLTADISLPEFISAPQEFSVVTQWIPEGEYIGEDYTDGYYTGDVPPDYIPDGIHEIGEYLGSFKITRYCPCDICNGGWGPYTAWAGEIIPGQTIGVNPDEIPKLAWVYIDGWGWRRAEDTGGGIEDHHIDVAVENHYEATHGEVVYRDVWIAK
ncbi:MAG: hypothetical protein LUD03_00475, partial [Firmicutes bacterium]|nr:hypothetical protein [Bacillota bacterium]